MAQWLLQVCHWRPWEADPLEFRWKTNIILVRMSAMSTCPSCGHQNPSGTKRCEACDASILQQGQPAASDLEERVRSLLNQGRKIEAIKVFREATGAGLAEAKEAVEAVERGSEVASQAGPGDDL